MGWLPKILCKAQYFVYLPSKVPVFPGPSQTYWLPSDIIRNTFTNPSQMLRQIVLIIVPRSAPRPVSVTPVALHTEQHGIEMPITR